MQHQKVKYIMIEKLGIYMNLLAIVCMIIHEKRVEIRNEFLKIMKFFL